MPVGGPDMMGGGAPGGGMPPPMLPKNPAGGPGGPGSSPALSPGGGAGMQGAAREQVKMLVQALYQLQGSFPVESDEYGAVQDAIRALRTTFKKTKQTGLEPAGIQQLMNQTREGKPFAATPPAGMQPQGPPKMPGPGGMPGAM